jgi:hypothetical protein
MCAVLAPWAIRNAFAFGRFMPLAPKYPNLRGEFVEVGYRAWLRTWLDDFRYVEPLEWALNTQPIALDAIPDRAFDSVAEKRHVAMLLSRYAHRDPDSGALHVEMTPQIDAAFGDLASERVARHPVRCTIGVGLRRAVAVWFDTHSDFYRRVHVPGLAVHRARGTGCDANVARAGETGLGAAAARVRGLAHRAARNAGESGAALHHGAVSAAHEHDRARVCPDVATMSRVRRAGVRRRR